MFISLFVYFASNFFPMSIPIDEFTQVDWTWRHAALL
jgi:hypothetical protein